jgi:peptidoglycan hydrolase-like protein with peptidoglycan-binding domain
MTVMPIVPIAPRLSPYIAMAATQATSPQPRSLSLGSTGEDVRQVNAALAARGYSVDGASSTFGPATDRAVRAFQRSNGLHVDGIVGPRTRAVLVVDVATGTPPVPTTPTPAPAGPTGITRTLRVGASGADVRMLHERLASLGYAGIDPASTTFTEATRHATMAFQKVNGIGRDGVVGPQTLRALEQPKVPDLQGKGGDRLIVDVSDQVAILVRGGQVTKIVNASTAAPGQSPTPRGDHRVGFKDEGNHPRKGEQMYYSSFFKGNFAVHGNPSVPSYPASHGCVRVPMALAKELYLDLPTGFTVTVRD